MDIPNVPLVAARNLSFVESYGFLGEDDGALDLTACTLRMEVRQYAAQPGDALVTLEEVVSDIEGIRVTDAAGGLVRVIIDQATLEGFPGGPTGGAEPNKPDLFVYDLTVTRALPAEPLAVGGTFTLHPGVTAP